MSLFRRESRPLLQVMWGGREIARVTKEQPPIEVTPEAEFPGEGACPLVLVDSDGKESSYDLASARDEGGRRVYFSIRVHPTFAVQADCVVLEEPGEIRQAFARGEAKGIRFQPLYLPECTSAPAELIGRGLFFRGFHFPGTVTPGNVSHVAICDQCRKSFRFQSFHAGFANLVYLYCETGTHTLVASNTVEDAPPLLAPAEPASLARFEARLPACDRCGKGFRYVSSFRCPGCGAPYIDFQRYPEQRQGEYYGNHLYGEDVQVLDEP